MRNKVFGIVITILLVVLVNFIGWFLLHRLYCPHDIKKGIVYKNNMTYMFDDTELKALLRQLRMSFMFRDNPSCGFDQSFCLVFLDSNQLEISKLYIALDGCGTFRINNSCFYLEGKKEIREYIDSCIENICN